MASKFWKKFSKGIGGGLVGLATGGLGGALLGGFAGSRGKNWGQALGGGLFGGLGGGAAMNLAGLGQGGMGGALASYLSAPAGSVGQWSGLGGLFGSGGYTPQSELPISTEQQYANMMTPYGNAVQSAYGYDPFVSRGQMPTQQQQDYGFYPTGTPRTLEELSQRMGGLKGTSQGISNLSRIIGGGMQLAGAYGAIRDMGQSRKEQRGLGNLRGNVLDALSGDRDATAQRYADVYMKEQEPRFAANMFRRGLGGSSAYGTGLAELSRQSFWEGEKMRQARAGENLGLYQATTQPSQWGQQRQTGGYSALGQLGRGISQGGLSSFYK